MKLNISLPKYKELKEFLSSTDYNGWDFIPDVEITNYASKRIPIFTRLRGYAYESRFKNNVKVSYLQLSDGSCVDSSIELVNASRIGLIPVIRDSYTKPVTNNIYPIVTKYNLKDGDMVTIGRTPTTYVSEELNDKLNEEFKNGTLLYVDTRDSMIGYPEFYYERNTYVADVDIEYTGKFTGDIYDHMMMYANSGDKFGLKWLKVEDIKYKYIKRHNILMADKVYEVSNLKLKYPSELAYNFGLRVTDQKIESWRLANIKDSINREYVSTSESEDNLSDLCSSIHDMSADDAKTSTISYSGLLNIVDILKEKNILKENDNIDAYFDFAANSKNQLVIFEYGEYPQEKLDFTHLDYRETGKVYHAFEVINTNDEITTTLREYYDEKHDIRFVKYNDEFYKVSPIEWVLNAPERKITTRKSLIVHSKENSDAELFIVQHFLHDIIPVKKKINVHDVVKSNIAYQYLMNKYDLWEEDLELDDDKKLILRTNKQ